MSQKRGPGYARMKRMVGDWTYEGRWEDSPFAPEGKFSGHFSARFVLDGSFVQERWEEISESGETGNGINLFRYDPETQDVVASGFASDGTTYNSIYTIKGDTMTTRFRQTPAEGEPFLVKATWKYGPGWDAFKATWQLSLDEGKTWKPLGTYDGKKHKD